MSNVVKVSGYRIEVSEDLANLLLALLYRTNWNEFPEASTLASNLEDAGADIDAVAVSYNQDSDELDRA